MYSIATFLAMMIYWALLLDLAIFSMRISAYAACNKKALGPYWKDGSTTERCMEVSRSWQLT